MTTRDVFLCHASEDKAEVLRPLVSALKQAAITFWYDEAEIHWGDSIIEKVNEGLRLSRYVLVVFSEAFVEKHWPQRELRAALSMEASTGDIRVLPLLVGNPEQQKSLLTAYPILHDKAFECWESDPSSIVEALQGRLGRRVASHAEDSRTSAGRYSSIPMPEVKRRFAQRDKDQYLRRSFEEVKAYFEAGARQLGARYPDLETDLEEIHKHKFVCNIYRHGEIVNRCKVWIGGPLAGDSISYAEGHHIDIDRDNSCNDWLTVEEGDNELGLRRSPMGFTSSATRDFDEILSARKAAEYLWLRATEPLKYV